MITLTLILSTGAFAQDLDCKKFKNGTFEIRNTDPEIGNVIFKRRGKLQTEESLLYGQKIKLKVVWIDQCTYTLVHKKQLSKSGTDDLEFQEEAVITVKIIETKNNSYIQESRSNLYEFVYRSEVFKIK